MCMFVLLVQSPNHPSQQHKFWGNVQMSPSYFMTIKTMTSSILLAQLVLMHGRYKFPTLFYSKYSILHLKMKKRDFSASNTILNRPNDSVSSQSFHHHKCNFKGVNGTFYTAKTHSTPQLGVKNV